jgi:hypothetical protein
MDNASIVSSEGGRVYLFDHASISGDAIVSGRVTLRGFACICRDAYVVPRAYGLHNLLLDGVATIAEGAKISSCRDVFCIGPYYSTNEGDCQLSVGITTFYRNKDGGINVVPSHIVAGITPTDIPIAISLDEFRERHDKTDEYTLNMYRNITQLAEMALNGK